MINKPFKSFKEIDQSLKILKLEREIEGEKIKLNAHRFKRNVTPNRFIQRVGKSSKILLPKLGVKLMDKLGI